jgi:segregation and condensation protein B
MASEQEERGNTEVVGPEPEAQQRGQEVAASTADTGKQGIISPKEMRRWGEMIRQRRRDLGFTLKQLAELTGISFGYLAKLERGEADAKNPTRLVIDALRGALNMPPPGGNHLSMTALASWKAPSLPEISKSAIGRAVGGDKPSSPPKTTNTATPRWQIVEALLLICGRLSAAQVAAGLDCGLFEIEEIMQELREKLIDHGIVVQEMNGEYQLASVGSLAPVLRSALAAIGLAPRRQTQLTQAQREVLALVIMHQPITRAAIERYRGVDSEKPLHALIEAELIASLPNTTPTGAHQYISTLRVLEESGYSSLEALHQAINQDTEAVSLPHQDGAETTPID